MKVKLGFLIILLAATVARAQTNDLTALLQQGLFEEQANRNLDAAIANYQMLAAQFEKDRQLAATAVFRLGECYRAEGKTNEAAAQYQRIISNFSDQTTLATLSRQDLAGMGMGALQPQIGAESTFAERLVRLQTRFGGSNPSPEQQVLEMEAQRAGARTNLVSLGEATDDQDQEIQRIKLLIQNSPDLINAPGNRTTTPPLIQAAMSDSLRVARYLLDNQANVNVTDRYGGTALTTAAAGGHRAMVELLLSRGADVNSKGADFGRAGYTALHLAAQFGFQAVIETLLANHADVNAVADNGATPLFLAAGNGNLKNVQMLLAAGANPNTQDSQGRTPLSSAVERGGPEVVKALLAAKADPNIGALDLPLLVAVYKNNIGAAEMLLQSGAIPDAAGAIEWNNLNGREFFNQHAHLTPLWLAIYINEASMVQLLLKYKAHPNDSQTDGQSLLFGAMSDTNVLEALLTAGANPNVENIDGRTPLSFAAGDSPEMVKMLLNAKADPNGGRVDAPLLSAIQKQDAVSAEMLLQAGASPNAGGEVDWSVTFVRNDVTEVGRPGFSITPLYLAVSTKQLPMVQLLLKFKADPNGSQTEGWALLFSALTDTNILEAVLDAGAKVDPVSPEEHQWTPLAAAAGLNHAASVGIFLKHGANPNVSNRNGVTPLHWAASRLVDETIFRFLLDFKADPNVRDSNGNTPLDRLKKMLAENNLSQDQKDLAGRLAHLLRQNGALDNPPDWNRIRLTRSSTNASATVFQKNTNDWNHFTLLEFLLRVYYAPGLQNAVVLASFPDLGSIAIERPSAHGAEFKLIRVNLLNATNGIDCSRDVPLEFGDVVEIPEREHTLAEGVTYLTGQQISTMLDFFGSQHNEVKLEASGSQSVSLKLQPMFSQIGAVLNRAEARAVLTSDSDLSRIKVTRQAARTGEKREWILDCARAVENGDASIAPDLWVRNGDVIEVPEKQ